MVAVGDRFIKKSNLDNRFIIKGKNDNFYYDHGEYKRLVSKDEK